jgi:hypothetical protein
VHLEPEFGSCCLCRAGSGFPWGANIAFRRDALGNLRFDPRLGRKPGGGFQIGEETRLIESLLENGQFGIWLPDNRVIHHTDRSRLRRRYLRRFFYQVGWLMGERVARSNPAEQISTVQAAQERIGLRRRIGLHLPEPLPVRLARLRDRSIDRGLLDALAAARQNQPQNLTVRGQESFHV